VQVDVLPAREEVRQRGQRVPVEEVVGVEVEQDVGTASQRQPMRQVLGLAHVERGRLLGTKAQQAAGPTVIVLSRQQGTQVVA
jgi:hypothetical protein